MAQPLARANSYYTEYDTDKKIDIETELLDTVEGFGKDRDEMMKIKEFSSNKVSVRVITSEIEKDSITETLEGEEELEGEELEIVEESNEEEKGVVLPKASNTGVGKM